MDLWYVHSSTSPETRLTSESVQVTAPDRPTSPSAQTKTAGDSPTTTDHRPQLQHSCPTCSKRVCWRLSSSLVRGPSVDLRFCRLRTWLVIVCDLLGECGLELMYGSAEISGHTWSHPYLYAPLVSSPRSKLTTICCSTTLSNEAIIAELAWSKAVIKAITGVTPNTLRPPYGGPSLPPPLSHSH